MDQNTADNFRFSFRSASLDVHGNAVSHGFWDDSRGKAECIALIHSELSEALEYIRATRPLKSDHIPDFLGVEEELADVVIRVMDMAHHYNWNVADAIVAKHKFNETRSHKHGKKF